MQNEKITVVTPEFRMSYPSLFEPTSFSVKDGNPKYEITMLFEDENALAELKEAIKKAVSTAYPSKVPAGLNMPIKKGSTERPEDPFYQNLVYARARSKFAPQVLDPKKSPIYKEKSEEIYGGCYGKAIVSVYTYDTAGNRGVAFSLEAVQKTRDGEKIGSTGIDVDSFFDAVETADDLFA